MTYLLISVFAVLFLKNLGLDYLRAQSNNCDELGHIHFHKTAMKPIGLNEKTDDEACHAGQSIVSALSILQPPFTFRFQPAENKFKAVFNLATYFLSPFLEGPRKPPRV